jgi:hypothetical protein
MQVIEPQCFWFWRLTITSISTMSASWKVASVTHTQSASPAAVGAANATKPTGCPASAAMRYARARTASHQWW